MSMLLKESEVFTSGFALHDFHASALLHLMLESAKVLKNRVSAGSDKATSKWTELAGVLHSSLIRLFTRFQDNERNIFVLSSLLGFVEFKCIMKGGQAYLKLTGDLFTRCQDEALLYSISSVLGQWSSSAPTEELAGEGELRKPVLDCINRLGTTFWTIIVDKRNLLEAEFGQNRRKSKNGKELAKLDDAFLSISLAGNKLFILMKSVDCRRNGADGDILDCLEAIVNISMKLIEEDRAKSVLSDTVVAALLGIVRCLYGILLWTVNDCQRTHSRGDGDKDPIERARVVRDLLATALHKSLEIGTIFNMDYDQAASSRFHNAVRSLRRESFAIIGDLRILFYPVNDMLHWVPSQEMMSSMRSVFDAEVAQLTSQLAKFEPAFHKNTKEIDKISNLLIDTLLYPLQTVHILDIEHLNRRQGAAVLAFLGESNDSVLEIVKVYCRKLKEQDSIKYLEVQMVALKNVFSEKVVGNINVLRHADLPESQADYSTSEIEDLEDILMCGIAYLQQFAQRVALTFGVGKLKGETAKALFLFFKAGIDFAMSDPVNMGFLSTLEHYVRYLSTSLLNEVAEYFQNISSLPSLNHDIVILLGQNPSQTSHHVWYASGLKAYYSLDKILTRRSDINRSQLDISEITRFTDRTNSTFKSTVPAPKASQVRGRESESLMNTTLTSVKSMGLHLHTKAYGTKRRRSDSISSNTSSGLDEVFPSSAASANKYVMKRALEDLPEHDENHSNGMSKRKSMGSDSHSRPSRIFEERKQLPAAGDSSKAKRQKVEPREGRRSSRSDGTGISYTKQLFDIDETDTPPSEDNVAYGLHIEDPFDSESQPHSRKSTRGKRTVSTEGSLSKGSLTSHTLFSEDAMPFPVEEPGIDEIVLPPSTRRRNR